VVACVALRNGRLIAARACAVEMLATVAAALCSCHRGLFYSRYGASDGIPLAWCGVTIRLSLTPFHMGTLLIPVEQRAQCPNSGHQVKGGSVGRPRPTSGTQEPTLTELVCHRFSVRAGPHCGTAVSAPRRLLSRLEARRLDHQLAGLASSAMRGFSHLHREPYTCLALRPSIEIGFRGEIRA
jgi:hypothetical protein